MNSRSRFVMSLLFGGLLVAVAAGAAEPAWTFSGDTNRVAVSSQAATLAEAITREERGTAFVADAGTSPPPAARQALTRRPPSGMNRLSVMRTSGLRRYFSGMYRRMPHPGSQVV